MTIDDEGLYREQEQAGNAYRAKQKEEFDRLIVTKRAEAERRRKSFFAPDASSVEAFLIDAESYRERLQRMLGWPEWRSAEATGTLPEEKSALRIGEDRLGEIWRLELAVGHGLTTYGLLFLPPGRGPHPLAICQHGGWGTPELVSGLYGPSNYNGMTRRILERGTAVFAPQLLLWHPETHGPAFNRAETDQKLKQLGSSIAAVEIYKIRRCIDYLSHRTDIDAERIGMAGLSYGGFYTLYTAALDVRIRSVYSSCFINDRFAVDWPDFTWFDSGNTFMDAEIGALIAPRYLHVEAGADDDVFRSDGARAEMNKVARWYSELRMEHRYSSLVFKGGHEFNPDNEALERFLLHLSDK